MLLRNIIICSSSLFYSAVLVAQAPPKNKTLTNVVGYQLYQQKQWNEKQIPKNSVLYKSNIKNIPAADYNIPVPNLQLPQLSQPVVKNNLYTPLSSKTLPGLNTYNSGNGIIYYKWQKLSWWKFLPQ